MRQQVENTNIIPSFKDVTEINYVTKATSELLIMSTVPLSAYRLLNIILVYTYYHLTSNLLFTVIIEIKLHLTFF